MVFTESTCPRSKALKRIFKEWKVGILPDDINDVDLLPAKKQNIWYKYLDEVSGGRKLPAIFVHGEYFGNLDTLKQELEDGSWRNTLFTNEIKFKIPPGYD